MQSIGKSLPVLGTCHRDIQNLSQKISQTSSLAEKVSAKVRQLDEARSRVSECQQRVHDLIDLQLCSEGVTQAIRDEDFEKGAAHVNRFLSMDKTLLRRTASDVSESMTSVSQAVATLEAAAQEIRVVVVKKFEEAVKRDDLATLERFFKIFPLLGMHDEGIERFFVYVCSKLEARAEKELRLTMDRAKADKRVPIAFADTLTIFLENFAKVIEVNQPLLETYYGFGHLWKVAKILQKECDKEAQSLIQEFKNVRQSMRKVNQINEYTKSQPAASQGHRRTPSSMDKLSAKDVDVLINEIAIMLSRAELYIRFIKRRVKADLETSNLSAEEKVSAQKELDETIEKSGLKTQMQEIVGIYLSFERFFMEESVLKAISLDTYEGEGQLHSSMIDDVFFIIKKCIRRSIGTHSFDGVCAVINNSASCLEQDYLHALRGPLKAGYPSGYIDLAHAFQTSIQQGRLQTSDVEATRIKFITQLNNADKSLEFIDTLWKMMGDEARTAFTGQKEAEILESCLAGLRSFNDSLRALIDFGLQQLRSSAIKPRLHPWVDQFLTHNHQLTEEEFAAYEAGETFIQYLIVQLDTLLNSFKSQLSERNYEALVDIIATDTTIRLERAIKKTAFNRMGGLILDQEIRTLGSFLSNSSSWSIRDKMTRLNQIATILNLEAVTDLYQIYNPKEESDMMMWRLSQKEIRSFLMLRTDFKVDEIKRLKF